MLALQAARLSEVAETARASAIANLCNFSAMAAYLLYARKISIGVVALGAALLMLLLMERWSLARRLRGIDTGDSGMLARLGNRIDISAALLGTYWGAVCATLLGMQDSNVAIPAVALGSGMMSAGAITFRAAPRAAMLYIGGASLFSALGLILYGTAASYVTCALLLSFTLVLFETVRVNGRRFGTSFLRRRALDRSTDTIQLLLSDVTEQGSDWLIEVDHLGRLINPCDRIAEAASRPRETLEGLAFGRLLDPGPATDEMKRMFREGQTIRRHIVSLTVDGEQRWWSLSARPSNDHEIVYRGVVTDITAQRHAEQKVSYMAHYDGLTDLPNRFQFNERLYRLLNRGSRSAAVMYIDLDQFKAVNDTLGHSVGDRLLQSVARRLEHIVGRRGLVARLGGDEFAVLLTPRGVGVMEPLARRIVQELAKPISVGDHDVVAGASIGMAIAPVDAVDADGLLRRADLALYAAKAQGRGMALRFDASMDAAAQNRRQVEMDLRVAATEGQLRLHYQPQIGSQSGALEACEALIRWEHPTRGVVMPDDFIGIAEETGLIIPIGEWAIRQALADAVTWPGHVGISINLSPLQMRSPTLVSTVVSALASSGIAPERVCLEITESVLMQDSTANVETLHKLRSFGIHIALDDFGTGYSSLNYLRSFPFSRIKIDRCFVRDITHRDDCRAIVRSVVDLAGSLGMSIVAEGVEDEAQASLLREQGCQTLQGYLFSRAVPSDQLTDLRGNALRFTPPGLRAAS